MKFKRTNRTRQAGFTMIEAIMVIVITGILSSMVAIFIKSSVDSYLAAERRAELTEVADLALRRLSREVRLALPNSLRVTTVASVTYIEFIPTSDGGRYRDTGDGSAGGAVLDFVTAANKSFDVLGPMPTLATGGSGDYIVVYNLGQSPADAYSGSNRAQVAAVNLVTGTITLATNPFPGPPALPSPNSRFQVVPFATRAVTYACPTAMAGLVTKRWGYGFNVAQQTPPAGGNVATVALTATCQVDYTQAALQRNGILYFRLNVTDVPSGETVSVFQQIHVDNAP